MGVVGGGDVAFGFVQQEIDETFGGAEGFAVEGDAVCGRIGFGAEFGDDGTVYGDASGEDDFLGFAAGGDACGGEDFLEAVHGGD